jgi:hypothetical protein
MEIKKAAGLTWPPDRNEPRSASPPAVPSTTGLRLPLCWLWSFPNLLLSSDLPGGMRRRFLSPALLLNLLFPHSLHPVLRLHLIAPAVLLNCRRPVFGETAAR